MNVKQKTIHKSDLISIGFIILAAVCWIPTIVFGNATTDAYLYSFPLGIVAFAFSLYRGRVLRILISFFLVVSFGLYWIVGTVTVEYNEIELHESISAPSGTTILKRREILEIISENNESAAFIYFGRSSSSPCKTFEPVLNDAIDIAGVTVYYYDTEKNKQLEVDVVMERLDVPQVPYLIAVSKGKVIEGTSSATVEEIRSVLEST